MRESCVDSLAKEISRVSCVFQNLPNILIEMDGSSSMLNIELTLRWTIEIWRNIRTRINEGRLCCRTVFCTLMEGVQGIEKSSIRFQKHPRHVPAKHQEVLNDSYTKTIRMISPVRLHDGPFVQFIEFLCRSHTQQCPSRREKNSWFIEISCSSILPTLP